VKTKLKEILKTLKTTKEATEVNKHDVADGHESETQSPWKNLKGRPICSLYRKIEISRACETKLGCLLSFLEKKIKTVQ